MHYMLKKSDHRGDYRVFGAERSYAWDGRVTSLGAPFLRAFDVHLDPNTGSVSLSGPGVSSGRPVHCSNMRPALKSWKLPVGALCAGVALLIAAAVLSAS